MDDKFWDRVDKNGECWLWMGGRYKAGYGVCKADRSGYAHRYAWKITNGPIPDGLWVLHHCDNPPCVRPDHLWLGTAKDNAQDRDRKGRDRYSRGYVSVYVRRTHCKNGHRYTKETTVDGECLFCRRERFRRAYEKRLLRVAADR